MSRLPNNTVSTEEISRTRDQALILQRDIADIQYVMTEEEQRGIYSLIRNLEFEIFEREQHHSNIGQAGEVASPALRQFLERIKESQNEQ